MRRHIRQYSWAVLAAALAGCDSSVAPIIEPPVPGPAAYITAVSDTNFTGLAGSVQALQVKITDAKGMNVPGVSVSWKVISGQGSISPERSTTDASGIASSSWTLGAWADSQAMRVESGALQPVEFRGLVPTASFAITPSEVKMWVGDTAELKTVARDQAGTVLQGAKPSWSTTSAAIATISSDGVLTGTSAGLATVTARFREVQAQTNTTVLPVVRVKVWSLDGQDVSGQKAVVEWESKSATAAIIAASTHGQAVFRLPEIIPTDSRVRIYVDAESRPRHYHPSILFDSVGQVPAELKTGLVPLLFSINFGCHAGQSVEVSAKTALTRLAVDPHGTPFYGDWPIFSVPKEALPIKVGIDTTGVTAADGDAAWAALQDLEDCIWPEGQLYRRVSPDSVSDTSIKGLKVKFDLNANWSCGGAWMRADFPGIGQVWGGTIILSWAPSEKPPPDWKNTEEVFAVLVQHEAIHALGFGHAPRIYPSIMGTNWPLDWLNRRLAPHDVAYIRMMQLAYELVLEHQIPPENVFVAAGRGEEVFGR